MQILLLVAVLNQGATLPPVRDPAFAADGRLAVSFEGDLWLRDAGGRRWTRLTTGAAWDRQPAWSPDGQAIVFVSDRSGGSHLFRLNIRGGQVERLTNDALPDAEPTVARDGAVAFVRGGGNAARVWVRTAAGAESRLTRTELQERWPVASPDGSRLAYVQFADGARRLRVRPVSVETPAARGGSGGRGGRGAAAPDPDSIVVADRAPERPTWSPDGARLAFYSATPRAGVYVTSTSGTYVNAVALRRGVPSWSPDGRTLLIAERGADEPGYNGDPDRAIDRTATEQFSPGAQQMVVVDAPVAPDETPVNVTVGVSLDRAARNAEAFDRVWTRMDRVYFAVPGAEERRSRWNALKETYRSRALAATDDQALERVLYDLSRARPPLKAEASGRAAVSSAHPVATEAGLEIFRKGGNAVDAAVAVSFALGVVEPDASGVGGYGEMLVQVPGMEKPALIEFMARVPEEASLSNASLQENGRYPSDGPLLAMVPGTVSGMHTAWTRYGSKKVPWADLIAPAIRAAKNGYEVSEGLATTLMRERESFAKYESSRALFFRDGKPRVAGDTIRNPDLAWVLEQVARAGADGFYRGAVAERLVGDLRGKGSAIRLTDLSRYFAADREPMTTTYRGTTVFSAAPPVSGGTTLVAQLNLLEQFPQPRLYTDDAATLHAMVTAWQLVPAGRGRTGDPSLWPVNTEVFSNKDTARARWKCYDPGQLLAPGAANNIASCDSAGRRAASPGPGSDMTDDDCLGQPHAAGAVCRANGTTAFAVADAEGNVVAVTQTLGTWGGNFYVSPGLGFLYNDKLTSYGTDPNSYGARIPFARHGSTLAPTIVFRGNGNDRRPILAVGAAGNQWITSAVYQTLVGVVDFGLGPQQALELPRFIPSGRGGGPGGGPPAASGSPVAGRQLTVDIEDGFSPDVMARLKAMGYEFNRISVRGELRMGYGAAVVLGNGVVTAGADPRRAGTAGAVK
ncbi:MAG TPA: gamma-glutamyltransferase [Gemmatimonadaceae bacterium]|nr:gamma-glutamyltransferase [Gemmatimonadaceae bacterium]